MLDYESAVANPEDPLQGQENERFFAMQAELEKQFSVLAAQLEGPVSEFEDAERESQVPGHSYTWSEGRMLHS